MLDVHAPEHRVHGARDFFMHLFTITVGLFIALSLENAAEAWHHRHLRKEAEAQIRSELEANRNLLLQGAPMVQGELQQMSTVLQTLESLSQSKPTTLLHEDQFQFHEAPIQDAAWRTANATGAISYMEYDEVERFSEAYKQQALLQTMEEQALEDYLQLTPILSHHGTGGVVDPDVARDAIPYTRHAMAHLSGMLAVGAGTLGSYEAALKQ